MNHVYDNYRIKHTYIKGGLFIINYSNSILIKAYAFFIFLKHFHSTNIVKIKCINTINQKKSLKEDV